ncbi:MAG: ADP-ribosyltransferase, partial [Thermotogota bacterium]|nr:ADP-ribosyltransferase [Thermotogota bacterium]
SGDKPTKTDEKKDNDGKNQQEEGGELSKEQVEAIDFYQTKAYTAINKRLREGLEMPDKLKEIVDSLDKSFKETDKKQTVYRGVTVSGDELKKLSSLKEGDIYSDKAYISTSMDKEEADIFAFDDKNSFTFEIEIPKGAKALDLSETSELMKDEKELLLPKDSKFEIVSKDNNNIKMKLIDTENGKK